MAVCRVVLAHQGGWDEMLFVAIPILLFVGMLRMANRRADRQVRAGTTNGSTRPGSNADQGHAEKPSRPDADVGADVEGAPHPDSSEEVAHRRDGVT